MALLVTRVFANHHDIAVATNDFAFFAHWLNTGAHLHGLSFVLAGLVPQWFPGPFLLSAYLYR